MPSTVEIELHVKVNGEPLHGFPVIRRIEADDQRTVDTTIPVSTTRSLYTLPDTDVANPRVIVYTIDRNAKLEAVSIAGTLSIATLDGGAVIAIIDAAALTTGVILQLENEDAVNPVQMQGLVAG